MYSRRPRRRFLREGYYDKYKAEGNWVKMKADKKGLTITLQRLDDDELDELREAVEDNNFEFAYEMFEDIIANSEFVFHQNLGDSGLGMTDAPGFSLGIDVYGYDDDEFDDEDGRLFYYNNYARYFIIEELLNKGKVFFHEAK